jgi:hypothetical protein
MKTERSDVDLEFIDFWQEQGAVGVLPPMLGLAQFLVRQHTQRSIVAPHAHDALDDDIVLLLESLLLPLPLPLPGDHVERIQPLLLPLLLLAQRTLPPVDFRDAPQQSLVLQVPPPLHFPLVGRHVLLQLALVGSDLRPREAAGLALEVELGWLQTLLLPVSSVPFLAVIPPEVPAHQ